MAPRHDLPGPSGKYRYYEPDVPASLSRLWAFLLDRAYEVDYFYDKECFGSELVHFRKPGRPTEIGSTCGRRRRIGPIGCGVHHLVGTPNQTSPTSIGRDGGMANNGRSADDRYASLNDISRRLCGLSSVMREPRRVMRDSDGHPGARPQRLEDTGTGMRVGGDDC
jgi:hypothetical protein